MIMQNLEKQTDVEKFGGHSCIGSSGVGIRRSFLTASPVGITTLYLVCGPSSHHFSSLLPERYWALHCFPLSFCQPFSPRYVELAMGEK